MDLKKLVTSAETLAQDLAAGAAGPMPQVQPQTPKGKAGYDRLMDALNRLPRPLMALGALGVFVAAGIKPDWFEAQMQVAVGGGDHDVLWRARGALSAAKSLFQGVKSGGFLNFGATAALRPQRLSLTCAILSGIPQGMRQDLIR